MGANTEIVDYRDFNRIIPYEQFVMQAMMGLLNERGFRGLSFFTTLDNNPPIVLMSTGSLNKRTAMEGFALHLWDGFESESKRLLQKLTAETIEEGWHEPSWQDVIAVAIDKVDVVLQKLTQAQRVNDALEKLKLPKLQLGQSLFIVAGDTVVFGQGGQKVFNLDCDTDDNWYIQNGLPLPLRPLYNLSRALFAQSHFPDQSVTLESLEPFINYLVERHSKQTVIVWDTAMAAARVDRQTDGNYSISKVVTARRYWAIFDPIPEDVLSSIFVSKLPEGFRINSMVGLIDDPRLVKYMVAIGTEPITASRNSVGQVTSGQSITTYLKLAEESRAIDPMVVAEAQLAILGNVVGFSAFKRKPKRNNQWNYLPH